MAYVVISYDLHDAPPADYSKLDKALEKKGFAKAPVDSTWSRDYPALSRADAVKTAKKQFAEAATAATVTDYTLVIFSTQEKAIEIELHKS